MLNAVSKWNDDINYVNTLKGPDKRIVIIGAFRKFISKEKQWELCVNNIISILFVI